MQHVAKYIQSGRLKMTVYFAQTTSNQKDCQMKQQKKFSHDEDDIMLTVFGIMRRTKAPKKSLRVVDYKVLPTKELGLDGITRAYSLKLAKGHTFKIGIVDSYQWREELLRKCKELEQFIPLVVETGVEKIENLIATLFNLLRNGIKYVRRKSKRVHPIHRNHMPAYAH